MIDGLYLRDTPEGRAIEQIARSLSDRTEPGQLAMTRKLARIAATAMIELIGHDETSKFFAGVSFDCLKLRGQAKGARKNDR